MCRKPVGEGAKRVTMGEATGMAGRVISSLPCAITIAMVEERPMKMVGVRLYDWPCDEIEREATVLGLSIAEIVRRRVLRGHPLDLIANLVRSVKDALPPDLGQNVDKYLRQNLRDRAR